jgi:hypothetical protein
MLLDRYSFRLILMAGALRFDRASVMSVLQNLFSPHDLAQGA